MEDSKLRILSLCSRIRPLCQWCFGLSNTLIGTQSTPWGVISKHGTLRECFLSKRETLRVLYIGVHGYSCIYIGTRSTPWSVIYTNSPTTNATRSLSNLLKSLSSERLPIASHSVCGQKMGNNTTLPVFTTRDLYK